MERSNHTRRTRGVRRIAPVVLLAALAGCTPLDDFLASVPVFAFMRESPAFDPYEAPRPAPENSVPFASPHGAALPPADASETGLLALAEQLGENPVPMDDASIEIGQEMYQRVCFACHGPTGEGDGPVVGAGKFPPLVTNLRSAQTIQRSDGYLYAIIRAGRGLMPAYATQTTHEQRWHIVNYVRYLQQQAQAGAAGQDGGAAAQGDADPDGAGSGAEPGGSAEGRE